MHVWALHALAYCNSRVLGKKSRCVSIPHSYTAHITHSKVFVVSEDERLSQNANIQRTSAHRFRRHVQRVSYTGSFRQSGVTGYHVYQDTDAHQRSSSQGTFSTTTRRSALECCCIEAEHTVESQEARRNMADENLCSRGQAVSHAGRADICT